MARRFAHILAAMAAAVFLLTASAAWGTDSGALLQRFRFVSQRAETGVVVRVQYEHGLLGWMEAGQVLFKHSGTVVLTVRGEPPRAVTNLAQALGEVVTRQGADQQLGRELAQRIERQRALP